MMISKNFCLKEFIDPITYKARKEKSIELLDNRIIDVVQYLRDYFNVPITINNWYEGGPLKESGMRNYLTTTGATYSMHKYGNAADIRVEGKTAEEVRIVIRKIWMKELRPLGLTTIEKNTPTWIHIDCRNVDLPYLYEVPYK